MATAGVDEKQLRGTPGRPRYSRVVRATPRKQVPFILEPVLNRANHWASSTRSSRPRFLRIGHRNRLKPPFKLRQRGPSTFSDWMSCKKRQGSRPPQFRHCCLPPALPTIRCSSPPLPSSSTSASPGSHHHRCRSRVTDAGYANGKATFQLLIDRD
jgi:hypothetical protein